MMNIDRRSFYDHIRGALFTGRLLQHQVYGMEECLREYERRGMNDVRQLAYILGTIYHEVGRTMQPIEEDGKGKGKGYGRRQRYNGDSYVGDKIYYGRGLVQVTWIDNYERLTKENSNGWDFVNHPELLLQMQPSVWATFYGMLTGMFTGKKLSDYFNEKKADWKNARRVINGLDKADTIASYALKFYAALLRK